MCYRTIELANIKVQGTIAEQYTKLQDYCEELKRVNEEIVCKLDVSRDNNNVLKGFLSIWLPTKRAFWLIVGQ